VSRAATLGEVEHLALAAQPALGPWLEDAVDRRLLQATLVSFAESRVLEVLHDASVDHWTALKGSASAHTLYDDPAHRPRRDVDILVDGSDIPALRAAAERAGWVDETHASILALAPEGPFEWEYVIPIDAARVGCDVHRGLLRWREFPIDTRGILARARTLGSGWRVCAPADLLIHTALHAANSAFIVPLRSWLDVHRLAATPSLDWEAVVGRAIGGRARRCVWAALHVAQSWFTTPVPEEVLIALAPRGLGSRRLRRALQGQGRWPITRPPTGRLGRAATRLLVRDGAKDAARYIGQTAARELAQWSTTTWRFVAR